MYALFKAIVSAVIIVGASEAGKRNPVAGALVASLPLVSVLAMSWLHVDGVSMERLAMFSQTTFWYVLPSLPMFLLVAALLRGGIPFWVSLLGGITLTVVLYLLMTAALGRFGLSLK